MTSFYVAILERRGAKRIVARIPDLPTISAMGATRAAALAELLYLANEHVRLLAEHAEPVPPARDIDDIPVENAGREHERALIPVEIPGKTVKISISIDGALLTRIDRAVEAEGTTRSGYFATAAAKALVATRS
jgi:predicted RNase H-like HicB family nuclease